MNAKQSVFIATSLDGFIARKNGDIDWLTEGEESQEDYGYDEFIASIDALVMGRYTYEKVLSFGNWPYELPVIVLSSQIVEIPNYLKRKVRQLSVAPKEVISELEEEGFHHLYIDGGKTIQQFLRDGFIQAMTITRIPVLIGEGIPLFGPVKNDIKLEHQFTKTYQNGFVQSRYKVIHHD